MFPPRPGPGLGAVCKGWGGGGRPGGGGAPKQGESRTQPAAGVVASATEKSRAPPHPLIRTSAGSGRHTEDRVGAAGRRQGTGHADSGLELDWREVGRVQTAKAAKTPPFPHTHHPGPRQATFSRPVRPRSLRSPAPAGTSGAPAGRPPPPLGSRCRLSRYRSRSGLRLGAGLAVGGATEAGAGPAPELVAAGSAPGGDSTPG